MSNVILITGLMGGGKTLKAVSDMVNDIEQNETRPVEEKRTYYSNITGLKVEGINPIPPDYFDWRDTPDYSYIVIDEAQLIPMYARNRGKSHISVQELTLARKRGHKIIFITQAPNRLHQDILDVIQEHYHLDRKYGAKLATCYVWINEVARNPMGREAQRKCANKFLFTYPKKCYDYYESAQVANDGFKLKIPAKTLGFVALPFLFFGFAAYQWFSPTTQNMVKGKELSAPASATASTPTVTNPFSVASAPTATASAPLSAVASTPVPSTAQTAYDDKLITTPVHVIAFGQRCTAYSKDGVPLDLPLNECKAYANGHKPLMLKQTSSPTQPTQQTQKEQPQAVASAPAMIAEPVQSANALPVVASVTGVTNNAS